MKTVSVVKPPKRIVDLSTKLFDEQWHFYNNIDKKSRDKVDNILFWNLNSAIRIIMY